VSSNAVLDSRKIILFKLWFSYCLENTIHLIVTRVLILRLELKFDVKTNFSFKQTSIKLFFVHFMNFIFGLIKYVMNFIIRKLLSIIVVLIVVLEK
jgi:hypothetical protein